MLLLTSGSATHMTRARIPLPGTREEKGMHDDVEPGMLDKRPS